MTKKWRCTVCGYVHTGTTPPDNCPVCNAPKDKFVEIVESTSGLTWADGHTVGVAKGCDSEIWEGLQAHFTGECCEVGMYLAMSRQADREGYPEVAEAYRRIAFEEANHAARFAELMGDVVSGSTKENLKRRMEAEMMACVDKKRIATKAKKLDYDAIHDSVHEMCKDEARHGQVFEGLYERYFNKKK